MSKKRVTHHASRSIFARFIALVKRNPWKTITTAVVILGGIPGAIAGATVFEPAIPVWRSYMREQLEPIIKVQNTQAVGMDRFLLYQQQKALAEAKSDPAVHASPIVQERVKELESQAKETQARICKATGKGC